MTRQHGHHPGAAEPKEPTRLIALSDGLFATVLTLLVLDLRVPEMAGAGGASAAAGGSVLTISRALAPHFFSYLLTFLVAGTYWLAHHRDFDLIGGYDGDLLSYNLLFLLFIGLLPFSTAAISQFSASNALYPFYWALYAANISAAGLVLTVTWNYAVSHQLTRGEVTPALSRHIIVRQLVIPVVFMLSAGAEYLAPSLHLGPISLMLSPLALAGENRWLGRAAQGQPARPASRAERLWQAGHSVLWLLVIALAVWGLSL